MEQDGWTSTDSDLIEFAWGVIANAGWNGEDKTPGWQDAAIRWRGLYHEWLDRWGHDKEHQGTPVQLERCIWDWADIHGTDLQVCVQPSDVPVIFRFRRKPRLEESQ